MNIKNSLTFIEMLILIILTFIMAQYIIGTILTNRWDFLVWAITCLLGIFLVLWDRDEEI